LKRLLIGCAILALCGSSVFAEETEWETKVKNLTEHQEEITKNFNEEETKKILSRLDAHLVTYKHCVDELGYGPDNQDDPICKMAEEELDLYINHIIANGDKALLEQSM